MSGVGLDLSLGVVEIGIFIATMLYGMSIVQAYNYSASCDHDPRWMKVMVAFLGSCETAHSILIWAYLYNITVSNRDDLSHIFSLPWTFDASLALSGVIGGTTQAFFTYRVYRISRQTWLVAPSWLGSVARIAISFVLTAVALRGGSLSQLRAKYDVIVYIALIISVTVDIWNSAALCYYLKSKKSDQSTSGVINSIVLWSIETGLATTAAAILVLVCWSTMPNNGLWLCFFFIYSKLYSNTLLISLNARERLRVAASIRLLDGISITRTFNIETAPPDTTHIPSSRRYRVPDDGAARDTEANIKTIPRDAEADKVYGLAM